MIDSIVKFISKLYALILDMFAKKEKLIKVDEIIVNVYGNIFMFNKEELYDVFSIGSMMECLNRYGDYNYYFPGNNIISCTKKTKKHTIVKLPKYEIIVEASEDLVWKLSHDKIIIANSIRDHSFKISIWSPNVNCKPVLVEDKVTLGRMLMEFYSKKNYRLKL